MKTQRRKPRRFPETQIRLKQILDELRSLRQLINERLPDPNGLDLIAEAGRRMVRECWNSTERE
jgi:hypothetical protein